MQTQSAHILAHSSKGHIWIIRDIGFEWLLLKVIMQIQYIHKDLCCYLAQACSAV